MTLIICILSFICVTIISTLLATTVGKREKPLETPEPETINPVELYQKQQEVFEKELKDNYDSLLKQLIALYNKKIKDIIKVCGSEQKYIEIKSCPNWHEDNVLRIIGNMLYRLSNNTSGIYLDKFISDLKNHYENLGCKVELGHYSGTLTVHFGFKKE